MKGFTVLEVAEREGGQPVTVVYDREGNKSFEWVGALTGDILHREIGKVL